MKTVSSLLVISLASALALTLWLNKIGWIASVTAFFSTLTIALYLLPSLATFLPEQNIAERYSASWALVTGGSSGIGLEFVRKVARQGVNVAICALDNEELKKALAALKKDFPKQEFRGIGVDLGVRDHREYMDVIEKETRDIPIQMIFCNAGYVIVDSFSNGSIEKWMSNLECNTNSHIRITHLFLNRLKTAKLRGAFIFTSSVAGFLPAPSVTIYNAGKASLAMFASCLAVECSQLDIDVLVLHPGLVATQLADKFKVMDSVSLLYSFPSTAEAVASAALRGLGRVTSLDVNPMTYLVRLAYKVLGHNFLVMVLKIYLPFSPDWKKHRDRLV